MDMLYLFVWNNPQTWSTTFLTSKAELLVQLLFHQNEKQQKS